MSDARRLPDPTDIISKDTKTDALVSERKLKTYLNQLLRVLKFNADDTYQTIDASRATYADYAKTFSGNFPTTYTKMDFSGSVLVGQTDTLFDPTLSRIQGMSKGDVGKCIVSLLTDTSLGSNHWAEFQLRGFGSDGTQLFTKRPSTISLVKNNSEETIHQDLEFYFGEGVSYFEIWFRASATFPYSEPQITVIKI